MARCPLRHDAFVVQLCGRFEQLMTITFEVLAVEDRRVEHVDQLFQQLLALDLRPASEVFTLWKRMSKA
jgi:hypothetical protein